MNPSLIFERKEKLNNLERYPELPGKHRSSRKAGSTLS